MSEKSLSMAVWGEEDSIASGEFEINKVKGKKRREDLRKNLLW